MIILLFLIQRERFATSSNQSRNNVPTTRERANIPLVIFIILFFFSLIFSTQSRCSLFSHSLAEAPALLIITIIIITRYSTVCISKYIIL